MDSIQNMIRELERWQRSTDDVVLDQVRNNEAEILDLNTDGQLFSGIDATGKPVEPPYRPLTLQIKRIKGQPTNRVTLKDTGDFHDSFVIIYGPYYFAIYADDDKTEKLERKYGKDIFGLTDGNLDLFIDHIRDDFTDAFRKFIFS